MEEIRCCTIDERSHPELSKWCKLGLWRSLIVLYVNIINGKDPCWNFYKQCRDPDMESDVARLLPPLLREGLIARGPDGKYIALYDSIDCPDLHYKQGTDGVMSAYPVVDSFIMNEILSSRMAKMSYYYGVGVSRKAYLKAIDAMRQILKDFSLNDACVEGESSCDAEIFLTFASVTDNQIRFESDLYIDTADEDMMPHL